MKTLAKLLLLAPLLIGATSVVSQTQTTQNQTSEFASVTSEEISTVSFCEVLNRPGNYFGKTLRLEATYQVGYETAYLIDVPCVLNHRIRIGVSFVFPDKEQREVMRADVDKIMSGAYGNGRARVMVVGTLRNQPDRGFGGYRYRFDIIRFEYIGKEQISHTVIDYDGTLEEGQVYRGIVRGNQHYVLSLKPGLNVPIHHAVRVEWTNLHRFPNLKRLRKSSRERKIVFKVVSDEIQYMNERRWNRTLLCEVIGAE